MWYEQLEMTETIIGENVFDVYLDAWVLAHLSSTNMDMGFMAITAASHQGAIKILASLWGAIMLIIFKHSLWLKLLKYHFPKDSVLHLAAICTKLQIVAFY